MSIRFPLASNLESRDGILDPRVESFGKPRDSRVVNGIVEPKGDWTVVRKRPGLVDLGNVHNGTGQLLYNWNGIKAIVSDVMYSGTISSIIGAGTSSALSPTNTGLQYSAANTGSGAATPRMMFKNRSQAWTMTKAGAVSSVSYGGSMGAETYSVVSLTRSGGTATATVAADVPYSVGDSVTMAGAGQAAYNGTFSITAVTPGVFTPAADVPITVTRSSTTATAVSSAPHLLSSGTYTISGASDSAYNGSKAITVVDSVTFTYTVTVTPASASSWNPSDKSANITLSGSNLTASSSAAYSMVRCTVGKSSGKWYWEVTANSSDVQIGIAASTHSLATFVGADTNGWGYTSTGSKWISGAATPSWGATYTSGDVIGLALDRDSGTLDIYKNGALVGRLATGITGTVYPAFSGGASTGGTANFGNTSFAYSIPSGYAAFATDSPASPATGSIVVTRPAVATPATFSYTVVGTPTTPATGTITVQGSGGTVPGIGYLNGYFIVMDTAGVIWNSALDDPTSWGALSFITAQSDSSRGMGLAVSRNYVVAFKEWSTEFFYDAKNSTGSPFAPVDSGVLQTGCASGWSIASIDDTVFWMSQTKAKGRGIHMLSGLQATKISTPDVDRILENIDITTVYAYCIKTAGHTFYVLTIAQDLWVSGKDGITLVYDFTTQNWGEWTTGGGVSGGTTSGTVSSITRIGSTCTVSYIGSGSIGLVDGMGLKFSGANQSEYNGIHQISLTSNGSLTFKTTGTPLTPATGTITFTGYIPTRFPFVNSAAFGDDVFFLTAAGNVIALDDQTYTDSNGYWAGAPIDFIMRTPKLDGQSIEIKRVDSLTVIGTKVTDWCMARWSNDDFKTWTDYRFINLASEKPQLRRCGKFRRRAHEIRYTGNASPIFEALELDISGGPTNGQ